MLSPGFNTDAVPASHCLSRLRQQPHAFQITHMFFPARAQIDPRRFHRTVPQHIRKLHDIPAHPVICLRKQMAEVMREYSCLLHPRIPAQFLHLPPHLSSRKPPAVSGQEYLTRDDFLLSGVA